MSGLGIFKHDTVRIIGLVGDYGQAVVILQFQIFFIDLGGMLHRHGSFAGYDLHAQLFFNVVVNGAFRNLAGEAGNLGFQEHIDIQYQGFSVKVADALYILKNASCGEAGFGMDVFVGRYFGELYHMGGSLAVVPFGGFPEGFDASYIKRSLIHWLVNNPDAFSVEGLDIAFLHQLGNSPADGVSGAAVDFHHGVF